VKRASVQTGVRKNGGVNAIALILFSARRCARRVVGSKSDDGYSGKHCRRCQNSASLAEQTSAIGRGKQSFVRAVL